MKQMNETTRDREEEQKKSSESSSRQTKTIIIIGMYKVDGNKGREQKKKLKNYEKNSGETRIRNPYG